MRSLEELFSDAEQDGLDLAQVEEEFFMTLSPEAKDLYTHLFLMSTVPLFYLEEPEVSGLGIRDRIQAFYLQCFILAGKSNTLFATVSNPKTREGLQGFIHGLYGNRVIETLNLIATGDYTTSDVEEYLHRRTDVRNNGKKKTPSDESSESEEEPLFGSLEDLKQ
jgi:hypothetical protein